MPLCPGCAKPLETIRQREGVFYHCLSCDGRALSIPQLRRVKGDHLAVRMLRLMRSSHQLSEHSCPFCNLRFLVLDLEDPLLEIEGCRSCNILWLASEQYSAIPEWTVENNNMIPLLAVEINAERRLRELKEREEAQKQRMKKKTSLGRRIRDSLGQKTEP